jgi:hypothetical protein
MNALFRLSVRLLYNSIIFHTKQLVYEALSSMLSRILRVVLVELVKILSCYPCAKISRVEKKAKTYNSRDSLMVTHLTTNPPVSCLNRAERTGSLVFMILWSYVSVWSVDRVFIQYFYHLAKPHTKSHAWVAVPLENQPVVTQATVQIATTFVHRYRQFTLT